MKNVQVYNIVILMFNLFFYAMTCVSVVKSLADVCNAVGTDLCGNKYMCVNNTCVFKCEFFTCNQHGQCFLETVNEVPTPMCR